MCGIVGWIDWDYELSNQKNTVEMMAETLTNRGPDDSGSWVSEHAAFSHRRLIVIDPEGGRQPMIRRFGNQQYVIVYNGELYNTYEIRKELETHGYKFEGHSDTEVVLTSFIEWREHCVEHLNGIFAFAIWDENKQELFATRDRLGVKPFFYFLYKNKFIFGSEIKALLAHPEIEAKLDAEGLAEIFALGPARTPGHGVFKNIKELRPGYFLKFSRKEFKKIQYWNFKNQKHTDNLEETCRTIRDLFEDAVARQLISDVPIGTLLSGGLDSTAITTVAIKEIESTVEKRLKTFSLDFAGNEKYFQPNEFQPDSDTPWVKKVSNNLNTDHSYVNLTTAQLAEALDKSLEARDLPGMTDIDASLYVFSKEIKKTTTVALSGECADEIFGGYPWFYRKDGLRAHTFPWSLQFEKRLNLLTKETVDFCNPREYMQNRYKEALNEVPKMEGENEQEKRIKEITYLTLTRWMPTLLDRKDRMSMAAGLEIRVPFCDHRLVEYLWNVPWHLKTYGGYEKGIFRKALEEKLPREILYRKKSPYPKTHNPEYLEAVKHLVKENILTDTSSPLLQLLNKKSIWKLIEADPATFNIPWFGQLMRLPQLLAYLYQTDKWLRDYQISI